VTSDPDWPIRIAAFSALQAMVKRHGEVLRWEVIDRGFPYQGEILHFANQARGIFWPRQMRDSALSIKTTVPRKGRTARYDDEDVASDGAFLYRFQGSSIESRDNQRVVRARDAQAPLIYFYGVAPSTYRPIWPVYVADIDPSSLAFHIVAAAPDQLFAPAGHFVADAKAMSIERRYATVEVKKRLHQAAFRQHVLRAYSERCAVCRFPRTELLDAAHILPDHDVRGHAEVPNGIALCRLHHGAFDTNLMGFRPNGVIEIAEGLLRTVDGPTLEHGLKGFSGKTLLLPSRGELRPRKEYLEERYRQFRDAA
jgi:putative restriction endonuclease